MTVDYISDISPLTVIKYHLANECGLLNQTKMVVQRVVVIIPRVDQRRRARGTDFELGSTRPENASTTTSMDQRSLTDAFGIQ